MTVMAAEQPLDVAALWRSVRLPAVLILIGLFLVTVLAAIGTTPNSVALDPRNAAPNGTRALAALLADRGITVTVATTVPELSQTPDTTIVLSDPGAVSIRALHAISATAATVLLIRPAAKAIMAFGGHESLDAEAMQTLPPSCALPAATTAGAVAIDGDLYTVAGSDVSCYRDGNDAALVESARPNGATTILLGSGSTLANSKLATQGDAALALGLLDTSQVQWVPGGLHAGAPPKSQQGLFNLLPSRLLWAALQLVIAVVVLALWRARRLGRPVVEPLPVVVRAAETVEGRARLLQAARARGAAAKALRRATIRRTSRALRLGSEDNPATVVSLVGEQTGRPTAEIQAVLYGDEPADDASLVRLGQDLPRLEVAIRHDDAPPSGGQQ
ncbi:MAG TPA: DUF4350 domain-containing protein [Mycobacteriales bacterium]|jgi:hypothetical protein|nr:DUF4350 domain-containing protein [Mycobacteriales bacterium]